MIAVVTGGAASGKSAFAESLALSLPGPHAYVATMRHGDAETEKRIDRHREMRAGKGFVTFELAEAPRAGEGECDFAGCEERKRDRSGPRCLSREAASSRTRRVVATSGQPARSIRLPLRAAPQQACSTALLEDLGNLVANGLEDRLPDVLAFPNVVVVANEVGCDGVRYDGFTMEYIRKLGGLACDLAARADVVVEVVAGIPHVVKGELPWVR